MDAILSCLSLFFLQFKCCGVNSSEDWYDFYSSNQVPDSCCSYDGCGVRPQLAYDTVSASLICLVPDSLTSLEIKNVYYIHWILTFLLSISPFSCDIHPSSVQNKNIVLPPQIYVLVFIGNTFYQCCKLEQFLVIHIKGLTKTSPPTPTHHTHPRKRRKNKDSVLECCLWHSWCKSWQVVPIHYGGREGLSMPCATFSLSRLCGTRALLQLKL